MSSQKFPIAEFQTVYCNKLVVNPTTTLLKWNPAKKNTGILILGVVDTAKTLSIGVERGIISRTGSVVGIDFMTWYYDIIDTTLLHVGMAPITQDFTTIVGTAVDQLINATERDKVRFTLTPSSTLTVRHESSDGSIVGITVHDMTAVTGQTMYPWVSTTLTNIMSVKIMDDVKFEMFITPDGSTQLEEVTGDTVRGIIDSGGTNITKGDSSVTVEDNGDINLNGGISFKCENITSAIPSVNLGVNQYSVIISNPASTAVMLPSASTNSCQYYSVIRNYPSQPGETWKDPVLRVVATGSDTVDNMQWLGIPPGSNIQVMSDGISTWRIM